MNKFRQIGAGNLATDDKRDFDFDGKFSKIREDLQP